MKNSDFFLIWHENSRNFSNFWLNSFFPPLKILQFHSSIIAQLQLQLTIILDVKRQVPLADSSIKLRIQLADRLLFGAFAPVVLSRQVANVVEEAGRFAAEVFTSDVFPEDEIQRCSRFRSRVEILHRSLQQLDSLQLCPLIAIEANLAGSLVDREEIWRIVQLELIPRIFRSL